MFIQERASPYQLEELNKLESISLVCIGITTMGALYFSLFKESEGTDQIVLLAVLGAHIYYGLYWGSFYMGNCRKRLQSRCERKKEHYFKKRKLIYWCIWGRKNKESDNKQIVQ